MKDKLNQFLLILMLLSCTGVFVYLMQNLSATVESLAATLIQEKEAQTRNKLDQFFQPLVVDLEVSLKRAEKGFFDDISVTEFNHYFYPFLNSSKAISSLLLANENGDEFMLLQMDSTWTTRKTKAGSEAEMPWVIEWKPGHSDDIILKEGLLDKKYDPRQRPWYMGALESGETVSWTEPYTFFTTKEPGITVSKKWIDSQGLTKVLAFDVKLMDISAYTKTLEVGENGKAFILTNDDRVLGLPADNLLISIDDIKNSVLKNIDDLQCTELEKATEKWEANARNNQPFAFKVSDDKWRGAISKYHLGEQIFYIGVIAPESDFLAQVEYSRNVTIAGFLAMLALIFVMTRAYIIKRKGLKLANVQNEEITGQKQEIEKQRDVARQENILSEEKRQLVERANKEILSSIAYAKRLQNAILPPESLIAEIFSDAFVLYKPKDIVAGDFYWVATEGDTTFLAAADCTGHGVPGAILSIVCNNALNRAVREFGLKDTGAILDKVNDIVLDTFKASSEVVADGMDISLLAIDSNSKIIHWSGANSRLWVLRGENMREVKGNRQPIGLYGEKQKSFATNGISGEEGTTLYLITDGIIDQFGGAKGKKFKYGNLRKLLLEVQKHSLKEQKEMINKRFEDWKGDHPQIDDVCVIGVKL